MSCLQHFHVLNVPRYAAINLSSPKYDTEFVVESTPDVPKVGDLDLEASSKERLGHKSGLEVLFVATVLLLILCGSFAFGQDQAASGTDWLQDRLDTLRQQYPDLNVTSTQRSVETQSQLMLNQILQDRQAFVARYGNSAYANQMADYVQSHPGTYVSPEVYRRTTDRLAQIINDARAGGARVSSHLNDSSANRVATDISIPPASVRNQVRDTIQQLGGTILQEPGAANGSHWHIEWYRDRGPQSSNPTNTSNLGSSNDTGGNTSTGSRIVFDDNAPRATYSNNVDMNSYVPPSPSSVNNRAFDSSGSTSTDMNASVPPSPSTGEPSQTRPAAAPSNGSVPRVAPSSSELVPADSGSGASAVTPPSPVAGDSSTTSDMRGVVARSNRQGIPANLGNRSNVNRLPTGNTGSKPPLQPGSSFPVKPNGVTGRPRVANVPRTAQPAVPNRNAGGVHPRNQLVQPNTQRPRQPVTNGRPQTVPNNQLPNRHVPNNVAAQVHRGNLTSRNQITHAAQPTRQNPVVTNHRPTSPAQRQQGTTVPHRNPVTMANNPVRPPRISHGPVRNGTSHVTNQNHRLTHSSPRMTPQATHHASPARPASRISPVANQSVPRSRPQARPTQFHQPAVHHASRPTPAVHAVPSHRSAPVVSHTRTAPRRHKMDSGDAGNDSMNLDEVDLPTDSD